MASSITIGTQPSGAVDGVALTGQPVVTVKDASGNTVSGDTVTATVHSGSGSLSSATAVTNGSGVATFSGLTLTGTDGPFVLTFTDGAATVNSSSFNLTIGAASSITIGTQPSGAVNGVALTQQPVVTVKDVGGNLVSGDTVTATVHSGSGSLSSATAVTNGSGVATFSGLTLTGTDGPFVLTFTDGAATVNSSSFNLT